METNLTNYITLLKSTRKLAESYYFTAFQIKKQIENGKIEKNQISNDIIKALNRNRIDKINQEITKIISYRVDILQNIEILNLSKSKEEVENIFKEIYTLLEKDFNILEFILNLETNLKNTEDSISEIELKAQKQVVLRQLKSENTSIETIFSFIKSDEIKNLNELLVNYYLDLSKLKNKEENLKTQNIQLDELVKLREEEIFLMPKIISILENDLKRLEKQKKESLSKIKIKFLINKNIELLNKNIEVIFEENNKVNSIKKWINLFKERISKNIINNKIITDKEKINTQNSKINLIQKHINYIIGDSGQILLLRKDRTNLIKETVTVILIQLAIILIITLFISWFISLALNKTKEEPLFLLIKKSSKILIWSISFMIMLSILDFNIGALLAGLGIGGFAIAIASKDILSDILGGLTIMIIKPFKVGDMIKLKGEANFVQNIGIRYTTLKNAVYAYEQIVPNSIITGSSMVNVSSFPSRVIITNVELSTNNSSEKIELALKLIKEIIDDDSETTLRWIKNNNFDKYSFSLKISYNVIISSKHHVVKSIINTKIIQSLKKNNIEFSSMPISILDKSI